MVTTKQVRAVIFKHRFFASVWTNKLKDPNLRSVKCYVPSNAAERDALLAELRELAGAENVRVTSGSAWLNEPGITVRCLRA